MISNDNCLMVMLENTVYWDGTYIFDNRLEWYNCDFCFFVKVQINDLIVIELGDCQGKGARFFFSYENEITSAREIDDEYLSVLKNATVKISLSGYFSSYNTDMFK